MGDSYFLLAEVANSTDRQHIEWQREWGFGFIIKCVKEHEDIRHAIQSSQLNKAFHLMKKLHDGLSKTPSPMIDIQYHLRDLHKAQLAWKEPYIGHTAIIFEQAVREAARAKHQYLAKIMPIVQSSGAGKSRLIDNYGNSHLGVVYTFRVYDQSGYPPGDPEITSLMLSSIAKEGSIKDGLEHATAIGLIGSTIKYVLQLVKKAAAQSGQRHPDTTDMFWNASEMASDFPDDISQLKLWFHGKMAPRVKAPVNDPKAPMSTRISTTRSEFRINFCRAISTNAESIVQLLKDNQKWKDIFPSDTMIDYDLMGEHQIVQDVLITPATELFGLLAEHNMVTKDDPAQFFIALDEVSNLLPKEDAEPTVLLAFLRVMRLLKALPMWSFILSTQRPLVHVAPATTKDSTARIRNKTFGRVSPFYSFLSGLHLLDANAAIIRGERSKAVACFSTVKHLARLGRPLWVHCFGLSGDHAIEFVEEKLFCGNFDPSSEVELFAFLSYRVAIDPCLNRVESASLEERTVSSHLRWVSSVRESSGMLHTVTLEEPIVSAAAASAASSSKTNIWIPIIQGMHDKLCSPGLIDRARTGELVLRCLVMMARDELFRRTQISSAVKLANAAHHISHSRPFKFTSFLRSLFGETFVNTILTMPAQMPKPQAEDPQITVSSRLGNGVCNFTHFASTEKALTSNTIDDLLHQLLYNQAALQLAANQKVWDVLIPIYFGDLDEPFDDSKISVLLIQVKNKENGTLLSVDEDRAAYKRLFKDRMVISILVDLGLKRAKCARQPTYRQQTWAYRITGHQAATYPCIPKELESIIASILHNAANPVSLYAKVSDFNDHWNHHSWNERCNTWGVLNVQLPAQGSASSDPEAMDTS